MKNNSNEFQNKLVDPYVGIGFALELLKASPYHRNKELGAYFRSQILQPLTIKQIKFYTTMDGLPCGMIVWARISEEVRREIHLTGRSLSSNEWSCGKHVFINDFIDMANNSRAMIRDMMSNVVPDAKIASSLRRNSDGSVRKVNRWSRRL